MFSHIASQKAKTNYSCCVCSVSIPTDLFLKEHVPYILVLFLTLCFCDKTVSKYPVQRGLTGSVILICGLFSDSFFVVDILEINPSLWGYVFVGSYLVQRGNGSWGVAAEAVASLDCSDGALEVGAVEQLRELQEAMAQDEQLNRWRERH